MMLRLLQRPNPKSKIEGYIGHYGLADWWLSAFSEAEREYLESSARSFLQTSDGERPLTRGRVIDESLHVTDWLHALTTSFQDAEGHELTRRIRAKMIELSVQMPMQGPGYYRGRHHTTFTPDLERLKREGRGVEAERLLRALVDAMEEEHRARQREVDPWYYEELVLLYRQQQDRMAELEVLERFARQRRAPGERQRQLLERLDRLRAMRRDQKL